MSQCVNDDDDDDNDDDDDDNFFVLLMRFILLVTVLNRHVVIKYMIHGAKTGMCHDVILYRFFLPESGVHSCTVGYTVALFYIIWICGCIVISQLRTVHMVKSVQLHIILLCNCIP